MLAVLVRVWSLLVSSLVVAALALVLLEASAVALLPQVELLQSWVCLPAILVELVLELLLPVGYSVAVVLLVVDLLIALVEVVLVDGWTVVEGLALSA